MPQVTSSFTTAGNTNWTCPTGITSVTVECWGGGGGGGSTAAAKYQGAGGGAGGSYIKYTMTVTTGTTYNLTVGTGGASVTAGGSSYFGNTTAGSPTGAVVLATGGAAGSTVTAGAGTATLITTSAGGTGSTTGNLPATGYTTNTAGTSGSAGTAGTFASTGRSGAGGAGANGGAGGAALVDVSSVGNVGTAPGGGGSGAENGNSATARAGGAGGAGQVNITFQGATFTSSGTFTVPSGVTSIIVSAWGGGGGGGGGYNSCTAQGTGGGGGGGGFAQSTLTVSAGQTYTVTIGAAGAAGAYDGNGVAGGTTTFTGTGGTVAAACGAFGVSGASCGTTTSAGGGAGTTGTIKFTGGSGSEGISASGITGVGGGGAGSGSIGATPANTCAGVGTGGTGTYPGGAGGANADCGTTTNNPGSAGAIPGGGGGGGLGYIGTTGTGGAGAQGEVFVVYSVIPPCTTPTVPTSLAVTSPTTISSMSGTITPNGTSTGYMVISSTSSTLSAGPVTGTTYTAGTALGGGTVQYVGTSTSYTASTSLNSNTNYYLFAYSYNSGSCGTAYSATSATNSGTTLAAAPGTPTAVAGNGQATVTFAAPSGTATITTYTVTGSPGGSATGSSSPIMVTGLTNGTAYTFTVTATNAGGTSAASAASNSVTPSNPCVAPSAKPTSLNLVLGTATSSTEVDGSYTAPGTLPSGYLIVTYATGATPTAPVNGTTYTSGGSLGTGTVVTAGNVTSFANTGLTANTAYDYYVYDYNNTSCSGGPTYNTTSPLSGSITTCVAAPVSSAATSVTSTGFTANWALSAGETDNYLDVSTSSTFASFVTGYNALDVGAVTSFGVTGLSPTTQYYYRITSVGSASCVSPPSATITVTTANPPCVTPTVPTSLTAGTVTTTTIPGTIGAPGTAPTGYIVISSTSSTLSAGPVNGTTYTAGTALGGGTVQYVNTSTSFTASTSLTSNTLYYLFVYSYNNTTCTGGPVYSTTSAATNATTLPAAPTIGTATAGNAQATVTFTPPSGTATITTYTVTSSPGSITGTGTSSPITVTGLTNGTAYTFTVTATNAGGTGAASAVSNSVMPNPPCTTPSAPTAVTPVTPTTTTSISGTITAPGTAPTGYIVISSTSSTLSSGPVNGTTYTTGTSLGGGTVQYVNTSTSFTASTTLTSNTLYYFFVYSYNSASCLGGPLYSATLVSTNIPTLPGAPAIGTATAGNAQASVTFTVPSGTATITNYTVTSTPGSITGTGSSSPITVTGLTNGTSYTFKVTATNAGGTGVASAASNSVTPLAPCTTPSAPTTLGFTPTAYTVTGTFTAPGTAPTGYLVIRTTSSTAPTTPVTGTTYTAGNTALGGYVVSTNTTTGFTDNGLTASTQYWYWIYSYNNTSCTGGPVYASSLNGNTTTLATPTNYTFTAAGASTFVVPSGVTAITVQAWGGGGGGGLQTVSVSTAGAGGGGGAYATQNFTGLTAGATYYFNVGAGGTASAAIGGTGGSSWFNNTNSITGATVLAVGGGGGTVGRTTSAEGAGGLASACTPTTGAYSGGNGGFQSATSGSAYKAGAGGGGSAGTASNGNNGASTTTLSTTGGAGGIAVTGGGSGGAGGDNSAATSGFQPGGGGGGSDNFGDGSGSGGTCEITISFSTAACVTPSAPTSLSLTTPASGNITGTFTAPGSTPSGYLVIRTSTSAAPTAPSNGTTYSVGTNALGGYIVSISGSTGFSDNAVSPSTAYWYWIYSYNSYCTGTPYYSATNLNGTITSSSCSSRTLYWAGEYSSLAHNTSLVWATAVNWSTTSATYTAAATPPDACTAVVIPLIGSTSNATLPLTANTTIASLTITSSLTAAPFFIDAGAFNFNILGNLSMTSSNAGGEPVLAQAGGSITVGGTSTIGGASDAGSSYIGADGSSGTPGNLYFGGNVTFNANAIVNFGNLTNATFNSSTAQTVSNADATAGNVEFLNITVASPLTITGTAADFMYVDGGNLTIASGASLTIPSGYALNQVTASTGTFTMNSGSSLTIGGATTTATNAVAGSDFPGGFATYSFDPASSVIYNSASGVTQTIYAPITYGNLTITNSTGSGASTKNITANVTGIAGNLTVNNFNTLDLSTFNLNRTSVGGTFALNGTATLRLAGVTATSTGTNNFPGNFSTVNLATTSTVEYYGGTQTVYSAPTYGNLTITTAGVKTAGGALNVVSNVLINTGATFAANGTNGINVGGNWTTTGTYAKATETVTFNGGVAQTFNPGTSSFNNIAITNTAGGVSLATNNLTAAGTFTVNGAGGFNANAKTNTVTGLTTISGGTYSAGTAAQTLTGGLTISGGTFTGSTGTVSTVTVTLNSGTLTAPSGAFNVSGNWVQASGSTFTPGTNTVTFNGTGTQALSGTAGVTTFGSIIVGGSSILSAGSYNTIVGGSFSVTSGGTFNGGTATQYFSGTTTLGAGTGTYNFNNFTISSGTLTNATYNTNFNISGNWEDDDTYIPGSGTITFNGAADQTITNNNSGQDNFYSITNNKSSGSLVLYNDISLAGTLTLTAGNIDLFGSNLFLSATSPAIAGAPFSATKMIIASYSGSFLIKYATISGQASYLFPIGDNTGTVEYSPITTTFTAGTFGSNAYIAASVTDGKRPANASTTNYLTRYWNLVRSNITGINAGISATYPSADIAGTESLIKAAQYNGALPWKKYSTLSSNTLTATGITTINTIGIPSSLTAFSGITGADPTVAITPLSSTVCQNDPSPVLTANVTGGDPAITYLWSNGATTSSISVPTATAGTTNYTVTITDSNGITATSPTAATVIVNATTVITGNPLSTQTVCQNATPTTLSVTATGTSVTYQWYSNTTNSNTGGTLISGATSSTYPPSTTASGTVYYYVIVTGTCGTATSTTAAVIVNATTTISGQPTGATYCQNATATALSVTATGTSVSYQWYSNASNSNTGGTLISGATSSTYTPSTTASGTVYYYVIVSGTCGTTTSTTATVTVTAAPSATISYSGSPYCSSGGTATVTISGTTGGTYSSTTGLVIDGPSGDVNLSSSTAGTYTVTYTVAAAGGCAVYTTTASITITTAPSGTINYYGSPYCPGTGTATVTSTVNTTGGTYTASPAGLSIDPSTGTVDLSLSLSGTYTVTYTVSGTGGCSTYTVTTMLTIGVDTWTGVTSTDWNDGTNWSCGHVPSINSDAVIPAVGGYYPSVSTAGPAATVHNLTINSGASLTVTSQTLQVSDSINNSGTFDVSIGTLELNGRNPQFIPAGAFTGNKIRNLVISNNVSLNGTDSLTGNLSFGASLDTFSTNGNLTLRSTASRTGSVGIIANGNAISGNVTVERYIATGPGTLPSDHAKSWELLAVPTMGQTINQSWMEGATASNVALQGAGASNPKPGYGTMITSNVANAATFPTPGFDAYTAPGPTVKAYNYATNSYVGPATTGAAVYDQRGWFTFVRGDRSVYTASGAGSTADHTILRTTGTLITPAVSQPVSTVPAGYFQSVGNPFASPVDMTRISATGGMINQYIYVWDPRVGGSYNYGAFVTLQFDGTNYRVQTNGGYSYPANDTVYNYIQNGQAFFMYANAANGDGTVTFPETAKVPDTTFITPFTRQGDGGTVNSLPGTGARVTGTQTPSIRTSLNTVNADGSTGSVVDQVLNQYDDSYSNSVDGYDGRKAANTGENLSINTTGTLLVVEKRHTIVGNDTIFLNLTSERVQAYQFNISAGNLSTVDSGFIIDNYLNTRRQLNLKGNTKINFNVVNVAGSYAANRFELVFVALKVLPSTIASVRAYQQSRGSTNINVDWSVSNEHGIQKYVVERSADSVTFTRLTVSKPTANDGSDVSYSVTDSKPLSGTNYYRIKMVDTLGNITYSVIVSVNIGAVKNNIEIYPNPVTDGKIHLQFSNEKAGKYGIRLLDKSGQVISEKQITRQEGNSTELLEWNYSIAHGIYQVEITRPDGSTKNINVLY